MAATGVLIGLFIAATNGVIEHRYWYAFGLVGTGFAALIWLATTIRCPKCGAKPAWRVMRTAPHRTWFTDFLGLDHCPSCGE